ncbi:cob(I)yrinic acid a,c-diamide adenosyltransferase [Schwartzia succinivorans]|jgi:cob(I)alamin adenosyltransferase|uniref:Corrinoid adenosyltransferase n=1 Tax=Schwartzia succinivorans DSM 10502 TaxID=1123243 RepID=A0A1M4VZE0_9FIRM|nr:cob(I)yrinic acid a,c-diamide adenosyltransferase [Schwartzia succinivorans]MBQ3863420.1 cob(I)yrinic acid a,c-diamide adenosyltransferase [Schwartzia sp. (in: firmicutes)]MBE6096289.1 cob(I)yrinic acid a,c-diamide adenosyltransferase [Schwartzia succinivorans]MCR5446872.1 cob(I)yrinic acid a,c-diamide adenosyltransferase [Schwartzia sp. (in: firmicutes)]MDY6295406.1 cob(I)yrinic acid a,c-diamide adenosyltransferase [Schwartzia succinivorans]SHE74265.1 cob(I)alamin adenosyltransferase [Schw
MGVYTKTGDKGQTSLFTGERVDKDSLRVETYGTIDEMNSALGMARAFCENEDVKTRIYLLQKNVSLFMADLASLGSEPYIKEFNIQELESEIDEIEGIVGPLACFLVPGDSKGGAMLDLARTIARRAERQILRLSKQEEVHDTDRLYINRLSDYCFMLMRLEEHKEE